MRKRIRTTLILQNNSLSVVGNLMTPLILKFYFLFPLSVQISCGIKRLLLLYIPQP